MELAFTQASKPVVIPARSAEDGDGPGVPLPPDAAPPAASWHSRHAPTTESTSWHGHRTRRPRQDGRQHAHPPAQRRPHRRRLRPQPRRRPTSAASLEEMVEQLPSPKVVWVMVPAGDPTRETVRELGDLLGEGDLVVDGGNSRWTDDQVNAAHARREGRRVRRLRRLRRGLGPGERLRPDVRRLRRGRREGAAGLRRAQARGRVRRRSTPARSAPATSRRWSTTASSTPSCRPTPRAGSCSTRSTWSTTCTEVFRSWREGTVIRSWLLDLLVAALDEDPELDEDPRLRRGLRRGPVDRRGRHRQRGRDAGDHRRALRPVRLPPGRLPRDEGVAAMRNQFGGHAVHTAPPPGGDAAADRRPTDPLYVSHLTLHDFRSYADVDVAPRAGRHRVHRPQRAGQDQPGRGDRLPLPARLPPGRDRRAAGARRRRAGAGPGGRGARRPHRHARDRAQPRAVQPGAGQPVAAAAGPRADRPGPHGRLLPRGPDPGQGRPVGPAAVPRRPAGPPGPAAGRRPRRLRPGARQRNSLLKTAGAARAVGTRRSRRSRRSASGTPTWPAPAASSSPSGSRWSSRCGRTSARRTRPWPAARAARTPRSSTSRRSTSASTRSGPALTELLLEEVERRRSDELDRGDLPGRPAPRRPRAHPRQPRPPAAGQGLRLPRRVAGRSRSR